MKKFKLAVLGNPIKHSLSPIIHQEFAKQFNIKLSYEKISVENNAELKTYFDLLGKEYFGFNITSPFKEESCKYVEASNNDALISKSINTVMALENKILGFNTDAKGFIEDLINKKIFIKDQKVLILGAGGATKAILNALLGQKPKKINIINRDLNKANKLLNFYSKNSNLLYCGECSIISICGHTELDFSDHYLIINATSVGMFDALPSFLPSKVNLQNSFCYDLNYGKNAFQFLDWANKNKCIKSFDGLGMLINQAALAFQIWFGKKPNIDFINSEKFEIF